MSVVSDAALFSVSDRWWDEIWRDGNIDAADEILADPFVRHSSLGTSVSSRHEYKKMLAEFQRTLCRPETTIDDRVAEHWALTVRGVEWTA